uniref:XPG-I domain-containing protein n=1 Tax=Aegilops tauschii subsp. strangulata TaxID=200361 RepID=A0A453ME36_AEGTS
VLEELGLTMDQFIDLCILSGCDYCENIKGIGGQRALKLIRQHGCIEEVVQNLHKRCTLFQKIGLTRKFEPCLSNQMFVQKFQISSGPQQTKRAL